MGALSLMLAPLDRVHLSLLSGLHGGGAGRAILGGLAHVARQRSVRRELVLAPAAPWGRERDAVPALRAFATRPWQQRGYPGEHHQHDHEDDDDSEVHRDRSALARLVFGFSGATSIDGGRWFA